MYKNKQIYRSILVILSMIAVIYQIFIWSLPEITYSQKDLSIFFDKSQSPILSEIISKTDFTYAPIINKDLDFIIQREEASPFENFELYSSNYSPMVIFMNKSKAKITDEEFPESEKVLSKNGANYIFALDLLLDGLEKDLTWNDVGFTYIPDETQKISLVIPTYGTYEFNFVRELFALNMNNDYARADAVISKCYQSDNVLDFMNKNKDKGFLIVAPEYFINGNSVLFSNKVLIPTYPTINTASLTYSFINKNINEEKEAILNKLFKKEFGLQNNFGYRVLNSEISDNSRFYHILKNPDIQFLPSSSSYIIPQITPQTELAVKAANELFIKSFESPIVQEIKPTQEIKTETETASNNLKKSQSKTTAIIKFSFMILMLGIAISLLSLFFWVIGY